jgi:hypothetical protein
MYSILEVWSCTKLIIGYQKHDEFLEVSYLFEKFCIVLLIDKIC